LTRFWDSDILKMVHGGFMLNWLKNWWNESYLGYSERKAIADELKPLALALWKIRNSHVADAERKSLRRNFLAECLTDLDYQRESATIEGIDVGFHMLIDRLKLLGVYEETPEGFHFGDIIWTDETLNKFLDDMSRGVEIRHS
jgi:hypothetical protein